MNRLLILCILSLFILAGCAGSKKTETVNIPPTVVPPNTNTAAQYVFVMDADDPEPIKFAVEAYCAKVNELAGGAFSLSAMTSTNPSGDLEGGFAHLALLPGRAMEAYSIQFSVINAPYTFQSYSHYTMAANSTGLLSVLAEDMALKCGFIPLAGYYMGGRHFLSSVGFTDSFDFSDYIQESEEPPSVAVLPDSSVEGGLRDLGFDLKKEASYETRLAILIDGEAVMAEFTTAELAASGIWMEEGFYFMQSLHEIDSRWLVVSTEFQTAIGKTGEAVLTEAYSFLFPLIDEAAQRRETMLRIGLTQIDAELIPMPGHIRRACAKAWYAGYEPDEFRDYLNAYISGVIN